VYGLYTLATVMSYVPSVAVFEIEECRDSRGRIQKNIRFEIRKF
jgi:hypothetical protein